MTPEKVKQMQEQAANAEKYNANIKVINKKLSAATAATKSAPPDYDKAIALMDEAVAMAPNEDLVWFRKGAIYLDSAKAQTDVAEKTKRNTEAFNDLQKAVDLKKTAMANSATATPGKPPAPGGSSGNTKRAGDYDNLGIAAGKIGKNGASVDRYKQADNADAADYAPAH